MKAIQITVNEELLAAVDRVLRGERRRRSAFIRQSIVNELKRLKRSRLEEAERRAYRKSPIQPGEFEMDLSQLAWGDEWNPRRRNRRQ